MTTPYHACYFAYELTRQGGKGIERLSRSLFDACVDLNPHQIEAALFALRSPVSKGVLLADEVGLGKTIEAGLVLCFSASKMTPWGDAQQNFLTHVFSFIMKPLQKNNSKTSFHYLESSFSPIKSLQNNQLTKIVDFENTLIKNILLY